ncbi:sugar phosphate isomerase/epimerase family protein [Komagataeibacter europaeus]|uniref:sugar phosphate isomerase/epimerase family protein n=1 Tax=Komagataeibacter europaeus TaxID=33995 RepID=UPI000237F116|nr:sugar phosphate isomerase/epimerase [Komagataeibacter europaeus]
MQLDVFKTLWGDTRPWDQPVADMRAAGFDGIEARIPPTAAQAAECARILRGEGVPYIGIAMTGGGVLPRQAASVDDHVTDLRAILERAVPMSPRFINVLGGNDRWNAAQQVEFIARAQDVARDTGLLCSFETHRARILSSPWMTLEVIRQHPDVLFTTDISHWVVICERLLDDPLDDFSAFVSRVHHVQARVGYDQGPQVPHPAAPEYQPALRFHQQFWEKVWQSQMARGYTTTTLTPECGPDGYLHTLPFTNAPVADLWGLNVWMGQTERQHFLDFISTRQQDNAS